MLFFYLLAGWQALDVAVHVATDQIEPIRILSNLLILTSVGTARRLPSARHLVLLGGGFAYLALNLVFVAQHGLVNPDTGQMRGALFAFVIVSLGLLWLLARRAPPQA